MIPLDIVPYHLYTVISLHPADIRRIRLLAGGV